MPRRRIRRTDGESRQIKMNAAQRKPGMGGIVPFGAGRGGGGTTVIGRPGGGANTQIEHVTLQAVAGQTISAGGGTVLWHQPQGPPTEQRGFSTLGQQLTQNESVGAIPVNLTGVLNFILQGRWASWRCTGTMTVTKTASDGTTEDRTYELDRYGNACRVFGGADDGWEVDAGDTMTYRLPNGSGDDQVLADATLVQKVIGVASPTSNVPLPYTIPDGVAYEFYDSSMATPVGTEPGDLLIVMASSFSLFGSFEWDPSADGWTEVDAFDAANGGGGACYRQADAGDMPGQPLNVPEPTSEAQWDMIAIRVPASRITQTLDTETHLSATAAAGTAPATGGGAVLFVVSRTFNAPAVTVTAGTPVVSDGTFAGHFALVAVDGSGEAAISVTQTPDVLVCPIVLGAST